MAFGALVTETDVVESGDPATLESLIRRSWADQLLLHPVSQLVDIYLAAGGDGGVFQAVLYYSTSEDTLFPDLVSQRVRMFFASDTGTLRNKIRAFYATLGPADRTTFSDAIGVGAGTVWATVIVYQPAVLSLAEEERSSLLVDDAVEPGTHPAPRVDVVETVSSDADRARIVKRVERRQKALARKTARKRKG